MNYIKAQTHVVNI